MGNMVEVGVIQSLENTVHVWEHRQSPSHHSRPRADPCPRDGHCGDMIFAAGWWLLLSLT